MTQEEKAKAYDEALKQAKFYHGNCPSEPERKKLEKMFPELQESNDERTKKSLIKFLTDIKEISESGRTSWAVRKEDAEMCKSFIAYLEKQKDRETLIRELTKYKAYHTQMDLQELIDMKKHEHLELKAGHWYICHRAFCCRADHLTVKEGERFQCEKDGIVKGFVIKEPEKYFKECSAPDPMEDEQKEQKPVNHNLTTFHRDVVYAAMCNKNLDEGLRCNLEKVYKIIKELVDRAPVIREQKSAVRPKATINGEPIPTETQSVDIPLAEWSEDYDEDNLQTRFAFYTYKDEPSVLYLSNVFVEKACRTNGYGTRILKAAEKVAEVVGATTIRLKVKQESLANAWYRKNGYSFMTFEDGYNWLEKNVERMKPNKQEWSDEDADMLNCCISSIEEAKENRYAYKETDGDTSYDREIDWLKSLPEKFNLQAKQEWNEEEVPDETKQECGSIDVLRSIKTSHIETLKNLLFYFKGERKSTREEINTSFIPCLEYLLKDTENLNDRAEWSEEDSDNLERVDNYLWMLDDYVGDDCAMSQGKTDEIRGNIQGILSPWLKSLSERFNLQPKEEWSEEVERMQKEVEKMIVLFT